MFKLWNSRIECILKALVVPDMVLTSRCSHVALSDHVGAIHIRGIGTVDIANDSSQKIQRPLEPDLQQTYPLLSTSASRVGPLAIALLSAWYAISLESG